jgi:hypothetical protein
MSEEKDTQNSAIGLDVGTSRIVIARQDGDDFAYQSQLNAFVNVPYSKMTEKSLDREGIPFSRSNGDLVVHGNESEKFADLLGLETRRPMKGGILNPAEAASTEVISALVDSMLGKEEGNGRSLYFSVPAAPLDGEANLTYHEAALEELLTGKGYQVHSLNEGLAVIYSELEETNYSGIGVSCGGGLCNVALAYLSVPLLSFSVDKAGDFIDNSAASVTGDGPTRIRIEKETAFQFNGRFSNQLHQALGVYYDDMIKAVVQGLKDAFYQTGSMPKLKKPLPLVLSGGTAMPKGFASRFEAALKAEKFPVPLAEVRMAKDPLTTTAKGALVAALAEA